MNSVKYMGTPLNSNCIQENSFFENRVIAVRAPLLAARAIRSHSELMAHGVVFTKKGSKIPRGFLLHRVISRAGFYSRVKTRAGFYSRVKSRAGYYSIFVCGNQSLYLVFSD